MLLQQIVGALDTELDRLRALRSIVSSLQGTFPLDFDQAQPRLVAPVAPIPELKNTQAASEPGANRRRTGFSAKPEKQTSRSAKALAAKAIRDARALSSSIPAGPVVVTPAALARELAARKEGQLSHAREQEPRPERGSLGSMIRALHLDATA